MDISLIVPVYNCAQHLERCLDSLLSQTHAIHEIICIDDASSDDSHAILLSYQKRFPSTLIVLHNDVNSGQGFSRDRGVARATGSHVMFIDSDDYVDPDYIERYASTMKSHPCDIVIGGYTREDRSGSRVVLLPHSEWTIVGFGSACAKLYRLSFLADNGIEFTDIRYAEDTYHSLCTFFHGANCHFIDYAGYHYCDNPGSTTTSRSYEKRLEVTLGELYGNFLDRHNIALLPESKQRMIEYFYISDMLNTILLYNRGCGIKRMREKYAFFMADVAKRFPDFRNNPYAGLFRPKQQRRKTRLGVGGFTWLARCGMTKPLFYLFALLR